MLSKSQINFIRSLEQKKQRKALKLFLAEGVKIVNEIILSNYKIDSIFATKEWLKNHIGKLLSKQNVKVFEIGTDELKKISLLNTPNQVVALVKIPEKQETPAGNLIVALESIRDPGNMGTIIRICEWFAVDALLCSPDCVDIYNPKVIQATMGSFSRLNISEFDLRKLKSQFPEHTLYAAVLDGQNINHCSKSEKAVIILGNESTGLSQELTKLSDFKITIPRFGNAESLNVAVACGIIVNHFKLR